MTTRIVFSGFGGQGVLTIGQMVATIAMRQGKEVTWMPSYGPEMRGGTANCAVIISDSTIGSPQIVSDIDVLCAMNQPSVDKFVPKMKSGGTVLYNSSLVPEGISRTDVKAFGIDATNIAANMGNLKVQNMVMLAGFLKETKLFTLDEIKAAMSEKFDGKADVIALNVAAIEKGM
ncbi:MAG: 2-oxoacid:acceptor oxidoreductase family protein [Defluviitaleaceae bacterium]|nr:2-oxoacid:acceptor oxidoreductase family protein [Defluviitaleaceae bacterium]